MWLEEEAAGLKQRLTTLGTLCKECQGRIKAPLHVNLNLDEVSDTSFEVVHGTSLNLPCLQGLNARAPFLFRNIDAADDVLARSHARVDIDVLDLGEEWAVSGPVEPTIDLPDEVEENDQRPSKVQLEEDVGVQVGTTDGVEGDVELAHQGKDANQNADVRAPHAEDSSEGEFGSRMSVVRPGSG